MHQWLFADLPTWFFGLLSPDQWDAWRNWLATLGGLVALSIATNTYRRNVKIKREEQARLVFSRVTNVVHHRAYDAFEMMTLRGNFDPKLEIRKHEESGVITVWGNRPVEEVTVRIYNGSKELLGPMRVELVDHDTGKIHTKLAYRVTVLEPESEKVLTFVYANEEYPAPAGVGSTLIFRDASGQWWRRHLVDPIKRVHDDPNNSSIGAEWRAKLNAEKDIQSPLTEAKVPLKARLHRVRRRLRGLSPTP